MNIVFKIPVFY